MTLPARLVGGHLPVLLLLMAGSAMAQGVYRHVDRNGVVSYSDQPPTAAAQPAASRGGTVNETAGTGGTGIPYELRQVVQRYPVTIYTGDDCPPCATGRSMLITRGVPFDERTVKSQEDIAALQRLSGQTSLPLLTIATQQLKGYSDNEWSQYLDAAGYPKSSILPAGYARTTAQPLVAVKDVAPPPAARPPVAAVPPPPPPVNTGPTPGNPAGIKF
jgi:glutaredoxin